MKCKQCNVETDNPKFCSNSCAATYNNKTTPKRKPEGRCKTCDASIPTRYRYCNSDCYDNRPTKAKTKPPKQRKKKLVAVRQRQSSLRLKVFNYYNAQNKQLVCEVCGYSTHVQVCHIKAVKSFPENTDRSIIDDISNLILLCPNHHWEFDHDILDLSTIRGSGEI